MSADPTTLGLDPAGAPVWAGLVDMATGAGTATLVVVADRTVSLYTSSGGAVLGAGEHASVARLVVPFLARMEECLDWLEPAEELPLPPPGHVRLSALVWGTPPARSAVKREKALVAGLDPVHSGLYRAAHTVLTEIRLLDEARTQEPPPRS